MSEPVQYLTVHSALGFLVQAGRWGATTTQAAEAFGYPADYHQRSNRVSQIMRVLERRGFAELAGTEPSTAYRGMPVRRWRITQAGVAGYGSSRPSLSRPEAEQQRAGYPAQLASTAGLRRAALAQVREELAGMIRAGAPLRVPKCWRAAKIRELRAVPCTLAEIGDVFGLGRERVRQIEEEPAQPCCCFPVGTHG